ncbi:hypothetical protein P4S68_00310 [Pseudoalteromonas sp. Hal099]
MQERMMSDREREMMERDLFLSRKRAIYERQLQMVNLLPKLIFPMIFMLIAMMLLEPAKNLMSQYERILAAEASGMERLPELKKQISVLEKQLATLTSQSIESRLSIIEKSIAVGDVDVDEVATLQKLKSDFEILKSYMFSDPEDLVKLKTLQRDYQEISSSINDYVHKDVVEREISYLNNMFYTVLGFLGILISIAGGSWYSTARKLKAMNNESGNET